MVIFLECFIDVLLLVLTLAGLLLVCAVFANAVLIAADVLKNAVREVKRWLFSL